MCTNESYTILPHDMRRHILSFLNPREFQSFTIPGFKNLNNLFKHSNNHKCSKRVYFKDDNIATRFDPFPWINISNNHDVKSMILHTEKNICGPLNVEDLITILALFSRKDKIKDKYPHFLNTKNRTFRLKITCASNGFGDANIWMDLLGWVQVHEIRHEWILNFDASSEMIRFLTLNANFLNSTPHIHVSRMTTNLLGLCTSSWWTPSITPLEPILDLYKQKDKSKTTLKITIDYAIFHADSLFTELDRAFMTTSTVLNQIDEISLQFPPLVNGVYVDNSAWPSKLPFVKYMRWVIQGDDEPSVVCQVRLLNKFRNENKRIYVSWHSESKPMCIYRLAELVGVDTLHVMHVSACTYFTWSEVVRMFKEIDKLSSFHFACSCDIWNGFLVQVNSHPCTLTSNLQLDMTVQCNDDKYSVAIYKKYKY